MKQAILDKVEESFKKAEKFYGRTFSRPKNIIFKTTGTNAGHSNYYRKELMFQIAIAEKAGMDFINDTPAHEVAHYIEDELYGCSYSRGGRRIIHGRRWKHIMTNVMGQNPDRCHSFDVSHVQKKKQAKHEYTCSCMSHFVTTTIHNKIMRGQRRHCRRCKTRISLKQFNAIVPKKPVDIRQEEIDRLKAQITQLQQGNRQYITNES